VRIVSLLPGATEIILELGLGEDLVGVSRGWPMPAGASEVRVVTLAGDGGGADTLDAAGLRALVPDLVFVGDGFAGGVGVRQVEAALAAQDGDPSVLALAPTSVEGVFNAIAAVGAMTETEDAALDIVEQLRERLKGVEEIVVGRRDHGMQPPRVVAIDALQPPRAVGWWIPDQVRMAGGWELLGRAGEGPEATSWEAVRDVDPEVLVLMPAGLDLDGGLAAWAATARPAGWDELRAVRDDRVFVVDAGAFDRPGLRIVDGIEILAELFDPAAFDGMAPPATWARVR
jgi:iron complex transport system substrate-binding protein